MLYRHFDSKADLYRAVLDRACVRLAEATGADDFGEDAIPALLRAASREVGRRNLARVIPEGPWLGWAANLIPGFTLEAVIAWLNAGQPDPDQAAERISQAVHGVMAAAHPPA
uniref:Transcriptional regulator, TetR family n=2 Tax=Nonomuraea gerenzanensis TaxID=93944 RepID=A0A1M4E1G1_9ACTN|nr:hypothetical protein [Nonomuraea gerenzanensis]SBO92642.1 Transcriptional regulator, TetR family [Nonomuraea gerenzanensis]